MDQQTQEAAYQYIAAIISQQMDPQQLMQLAKENDPAAQMAVQILDEASGDNPNPEAVQIVQKIAQSAQQPQEVAPQEVSMARLGAKLDYINYLRGKCPEGYEMKMYRKGGAICKKCIKKAQAGAEVQESNASNDTISEFRKGRKMKKAACGSKVQKNKK